MCWSRRIVKLGVMDLDADSFVFGAWVDIYGHEYDAAAPKDFRDLDSGVPSLERNRYGVTGAATFKDPSFGRRWFTADLVDEADFESTVFEMRHEQFEAPYVGHRKDAAVA